MDKKTGPKGAFLIEGLAGAKTLTGKITINGAKNAALKAMAASILFDGPVGLDNIPRTEDIETMTKVLEKLGAKVSVVVPKNGRAGLSLLIDPSSINSFAVDRDLARAMRSSVVLTGPMLGRYGKVCFPAPGGCVIGARPIDLFLNGYEKLGAEVDEVDHVYSIEKTGSLVGTTIHFDKVSVGATETLMMAAVLARGTTVLENCAVEPEIGNVASWLNECGANIVGMGEKVMTIHGTGGKLLSPDKRYVAMPDRIEAGSYLFLGALCARDLIIENCEPAHLLSVVNSLKTSGVPISVDDKKGTITISDNIAPNQSFKAFDIETREYPGFATDLQAPAVVFETEVSGKSRIVENIFEGRFKYVADLIAMGANISTLNEREVIVTGPSALRSPAGEDLYELTAHDIRAGFAIVLACLTAQGRFKVSNAHLIDRGYEALEERLSSLGANVKKLN